MLSLAIPTSLLLGSVYSKMELSQLKYFVAIANHDSFTKAAETLYVTQLSLSVGIKKLEQELGMFLLERRWRGVWFDEQFQTV